MAFTRVRNHLATPDGYPDVGVKVTATLIAARPWLATGEGAVVSSTTITTDGEGLWELTLTPASEYEDNAAVYRIVEGKNVWFVRVPDPDPAVEFVWLRDALVSYIPGPPGTVVVNEGPPGLSAYQLAVLGGFAGTQTQWLDSLDGPAGLSAYQVAVAGGFVGTQAQWLTSLRGGPGPPGPLSGNIDVSGLTTATIRGTGISAHRGTTGPAFLALDRAGWNVETRFGADPTGDPAKDDATQTAFTELTGELSVLTDSVHVDIPHGNYRIKTPGRTVIPPLDGISIDGQWSTLNFMHADGGLDDGNMLASLAGGSLTRLIIKSLGTSANAARNPCRLRWTTGRAYDIRTLGGFYRPGDTEFQKDHTAACIIQSCQNNSYRGFAAKDSGGHCLVVDYGAGGLRFIGSTQLDGAGLSGDPRYRMLFVRQSAPASGNILGEAIPHPGVYDRPTNCRWEGFYIEDINNTIARNVEIGTTGIGCSGMEFIGGNIVGNGRGDGAPVPPATPPYLTLLYIGDGAVATIIDSVRLSGNTAGSYPVKIVTGIHVAGGAQGTVLRGEADFSALLTCINLADAASTIRIADEPAWTPLAAGSARVGGTGARNVDNRYQIKVASVAALPTPGVHLLGVRATIAPASGDDSTVTCLRVAGAYAWVAPGGATSLDALEVTDFANVVTVNRTIGAAVTIGRYGLGASPIVFTLPPAVEKRALSLRFKSNLGSRTYSIVAASGETIHWVATDGVVPTPGLTAIQKRDYYELLCYDTGQWSVVGVKIGATIP